jgi:CHAD domain-containing protein
LETENLILNHWEKEKTIVDNNLTMLKKHNDTTAVYAIRVAIKRLRAYVKLYMLLKKDTEAKHLEETERLFSVLGKQRDIEISLSLVSGYEKENECRYDELKKHLKSLYKKTRTWTDHAADAYRKKELTKIGLLLKEDPELQDESALIQYIRNILDNEITEIKKHFRNPHKVRQNLKFLYYWINIFPQEKDKEDYEVKKLHDILQDLGKWQDNEMLVAKSKHFRKDYLPKSFEEPALLRTMEEKIAAANKKLSKSTLSKTRRWLKKVTPEKSEKKEVVTDNGGEKNTNS